MTAAVKYDTINIVDAAGTPALAKLFRRISQLTTLPASAQRVMQLASDESSTASDLLSVIEGDPVLAAKIVRRVNSAFYGLRHQISDLRSAISLLGFREIQNLALTVYLTRMFEGGNDYRGFSREQLWEHCVAVGQASRIIANNCRREKADEAYLAGLLHDMGLILLDQLMPKYLFQVVDRVSEGASTSEAELSLLPFDHSQLGAYVAMQWNFPARVIAAIRYHHDPLMAQPEHREIACIVAVANYLCHRADVSSLGTPNVFAPEDEVFTTLEIEPAQLANIWEHLLEALNSSPGA